MHWNHRVIRRIDGAGEQWLQLAEVYYNDDGTLMGWADICNGSETLGGLEEQIARFGRACVQPIVNEADFPQQQTTIPEIVDGLLNPVQP